MARFLWYVTLIANKIKICCNFHVFSAAKRHLLSNNTMCCRPNHFTTFQHMISLVLTIKKLFLSCGLHGSSKSNSITKRDLLAAVCYQKFILFTLTFEYGYLGFRVLKKWYSSMSTVLDYYITSYLQQGVMITNKNLLGDKSLDLEKLCTVLSGTGRLKLTMKGHAACCVCQDYTI